MSQNQSVVEQTVVVIMAAGKGTRMGRSDLCKVCFEIDSVPAVNRLIGVFKRQRFRRFLLVVGRRGEQVMEMVAREHPDVAYVYQNPQLGTGHAARIAADALQNLDFAGNVLVTAGDKYVEPAAVEALTTGFVKQQADMALLMLPVTEATQGSVGRVFIDSDGEALDIIERVDRARQAIVDDLKARAAKGGSLTGRRIAGVIQTHLPDPRKQQAAVAELAALARGDGPVDRAKLRKLLDSDRYNLQIEGRRHTARQIEKMCRGANQSMYLFTADVFYRGVGMIRNDNAQGEYYLTDVVRLLSGIRDAAGRRQYRVRAVAVDDPDCVQGFNSPDELLAIQDYVRRGKPGKRKARPAAARPSLKPSQYATVRRWLERLESPGRGPRRWLDKIYGDHPSLHARKCKELVRTLRCYARRFGADDKVCIVRAPGRVNLMGRHVDHRGGWTNFLAIHRETMAVVGLREDNDVVAVNTHPKQFSPVEFNIAELIGRFAWSDWVNFVNSDWVRQMLYSAAGNWGNYIKAAVLRLQHRFQDVKVRGINVALSGDVPIAAGLSSSSTIVVATLQAAIALNGFQLTSRQFVDLCGEGEWFVGSRGGAGDHAAIYLGQRGKIAQVGYLPFRVERVIDAPADYQVVIANSHVKAAKSAAAKHQFNAKVASYNLGLALLKQRCPEIAAAVQYVRDIDPAKLGCASSDVYRLLMKVPERMTRKDFQAMLGAEHKELIEANFATHSPPRHYGPRGVLLYGAAEILRAGMCPDYLESGRVDDFGQLMRISHDGDRVASPGPEGAYRPWEAPCGDAYLAGRIADLKSEVPERVLAAQLFMQPGSYACSTPEIDQMVDVASSVPGVAGSQIAGAGLGGCIMVLVRGQSVDALRKALVKHYYTPRGLEPAVLPCVMVEGSGLVEF